MGTPDSNTPADETGDGPVTIEDRVQPGGEGSPGSNQSKTEPMSPSGTHSEPMAPPDLEGMNVGAADPQAPRQPAAAQPSDSYTDEPPGQQPESPVQQDSTGTSHRVPGLQGSTPDGESVETDVSAGAARMGAQAVDSAAGRSPGQGDDAGVPLPGSEPAPGTSEEHRVVTGVRLPAADEV